MAKSEVKLLGAWPSPFVMRARIALNIKAVEYEFLQETLEPKSQLLIQSNPVYKKIPVLIHADKPICESLVIVQYIDDVWTSGPSILPSDPYDRAIHRFWAAYLDDKVLIFIFFMMVFFKYTLYLLYIYELDLMLKSKV
jgi:glutathione S-transferase